MACSTVIFLRKIDKKSRLGCFFFVAFMFFAPTPREAIVPSFDVIDTPTAVTLNRASYNVSVWGYGQGGILVKAIMGLNENIFLGVSFDAENIIGNGDIGLNVPGVAMRLKITDGWEEFPLLIGVGYDFFYSGIEEKLRAENVNPFMRNIYGSYLVFTKPIFLFGAEQQFHWGVRLPMQPDYNPYNTEFFASFAIPMGNLIPMIEVEKVFFDNKRFHEVLLNTGLRILLGESMSLEINFLLNSQNPVNRMLVFEFMENF